MDLRILDDSILFPASIQNGRFLGQNCSRNISDGAVLSPPIRARLIATYLTYCPSMHYAVCTNERAPLCTE